MSASATLPDLHGPLEFRRRIVRTMSHADRAPIRQRPLYQPRADLDKPPTLPDLPPVEPPSAGFVVQLFVIPALVVVVVIIVWLLFGKLAGGERDAMEYVRQLRSPTANWRIGLRAGQPDPERRRRSPAIPSCSAS